MKNIFSNIVMSVFSAFDLIAGYYEHYTKLNANNYVIKMCFLLFGILNTIGFFFLVANPEPPKRRAPESKKQYAYVRAV